MKNKINLLLFGLLLLIMPIANSALMSDEADVKILLNNYDPLPAEPDNNLRVWISVQNQGNEQLENAYVKVNPEYPFILLPGAKLTKETGIISPGESKILDYKLFVSKNTNEGDYDLEFIVCKDEKCTKEVKKTTLTINVKTGGTPKIRLGIEEAEAIGFNQKEKITLNIVNRGQLDTKFLTVTLRETDDFIILSPAEIYVGELESDDFETAIYDIYFKGPENPEQEQTKEINLPLTVEYSDENNKDYFESETLTLRVYSQDDLLKYGLIQPKPNYTLYVIAAALVILGFIAYRITKKILKKRNK